MVVLYSILITDYPGKPCQTISQTKPPDLVEDGCALLILVNHTKLQYTYIKANCFFNYMVLVTQPTQLPLPAINSWLLQSTRPGFESRPGASPYTVEWSEGRQLAL